MAEEEALSAPFIVDHVDSEAEVEHDTDNEMAPPAVPAMFRKKSIRQRNDSAETRFEILSDAEKRQQRREADGGLIKLDAQQQATWAC